MTSADLDAELLAIALAIADPEHPVKRDVAAWAAEHLAQEDRIGADCDITELVPVEDPAEFEGSAGDPHERELVNA